jgi:hypothetical protein
MYKTQIKYLSQTITKTWHSPCNRILLAVTSVFTRFRTGFTNKHFKLNIMFFSGIRDPRCNFLPPPPSHQHEAYYTFETALIDRELDFGMQI